MNIFAISGILIGTTSIAMAILMLLIGKEKLHHIWGLFCVSVAVWGFGGYKIATTNDIAEADLWWRLTHVGVIFIPIFFMHFVSKFLELKNKLFIMGMYALGVFFLIANFSGNLFIANMRFVFNQFYYDSPPGILYIPFTFFFFFIVFYSHLLLWRALKTASGIKKLQIQYFFIGMLVSFAGGGTSFLPVYQIDLYPILNLTAFTYTPILTYAIIRKQLFDIKVILTQLLVSLIAIFLLFNFFTSANLVEYLWKGALLVAFLFAGYLLIKSVLREVEQREKLEELSKAKSEFMSIASHQLRTPLSIVKGYLSLMREGSFGKATEKQQEVLSKVYATNDEMMNMVNDLLNVTRAEEGRLQYNFERINLKELIQTITKGLELSAKKKNLELRSDVCQDPVFINADKDKLGQVISNLIDNAIKYTEQGTIEIQLTLPNPKTALIRVKDTGLGIRKEEMPQLFESFTRGNAGTKLWTKGSGMGLYIAKQFVSAHKGKIWAESKGEGKGSSFFVELPL